MAKAWRKDPPKKRACKHCGAMYEVTVQHIPIRDKDNAICEVCGGIMDEWNATMIPTYTLIKKPSKGQSSDG